MPTEAQRVKESATRVIAVVGAAEHNLKHINVEIPRDPQPVDHSRPFSREPDLNRALDFGCVGGILGGSVGPTT